MKPIHFFCPLVVLVGTAAAKTGSPPPPLPEIVKRCDEYSTKQGNWCQCKVGYTVPINPKYNKPFGGWSYKYHKNAIGNVACIPEVPTPMIPEHGNPSDLKCYIGCYRDDRSRDMEKRVEGDFTVDSCRSECAKQAYKYFSVQYGNQCFCGNTYATKEVYEKLEDSACKRKGYPDGHGGAWANSVYETECNDPGVLQTPAPSPAPTPAPRPDCIERTTIRADVDYYRTLDDMIRVNELGQDEYSKHSEVLSELRDAAKKKCEVICEEAGYSSEYKLFETTGLWVEPSKYRPSGCYCKRGVPEYEQYDTLGYSFPCEYEPETTATPDPECSAEIRGIWADVGFNPDLPFDDYLTALDQCDQLCWDEGYSVSTPWTDHGQVAGCTCIRGSGPVCKSRDPKPTPVPTHASCKHEEIEGDTLMAWDYASAEVTCPRFCRREDPDYITGRPWMFPKFPNGWPKGCICTRCDDDDDDDDDVKTPGCGDWCYEEFDCLSDPNDAACGECDLPKCGHAAEHR